MAELKQDIPPRLTSLDAFRGFTIMAMLFVNNPGHHGVFPRQMMHAAWGEFVTFCDMIFPWFLFIVGVAIPFSTAMFWQRNPNASFWLFVGRAAKRAAMLVFLGVLINCSIYKRVHIGLDVLQLIGLAYFCGALIYHLPMKVRLSVAGGLLVAHWILLRFIPVPGVGEAVFEQDQNIIRSINRGLNSFSTSIFSPLHFAGLVSVVPTTALVLIGTAVGDLLRSNAVADMKKLQWMGVGGAALTVVGLIWHLDLEMNKYVWTASYILFAGGLGTLLLAAFYFVIDMQGFRKWAFPFVVWGMNAIAAYFISIIVRVHTVQEWYTEVDGERVTLWRAKLHYWTELAGEYWGSWLFTSSYIFFWFLVLLWMYRRRIFWRV